MYSSFSKGWSDHQYLWNGNLHWQTNHLVNRTTLKNWNSAHCSTEKHASTDQNQESSYSQHVERIGECKKENGELDDSSLFVLLAPDWMHEFGRRTREDKYGETTGKSCRN